MSEHMVCQIQECPGFGTPHPPIEEAYPWTQSHRHSAVETLSDLLRRDRDGDHVLTDREYNAISYAIEQI